MGWGCGIWGSEFRVWGLGCRPSGLAGITRIRIEESTGAIFCGSKGII